MRRTTSLVTTVLVFAATLVACTATQRPDASAPGAPGFLLGIGGFSGGLFAGSRRRWR